MRESATLVFQTRSPSVAVVALMAPRWKTISIGGSVARKALQIGFRGDDGGAAGGRRGCAICPRSRRRSTTTISSPLACEGGVEIGADEAGAAGEQYHGAAYRGGWSVAKGGPRYGVWHDRIGEMTERPRFFDDLAGVAGGAMSALVGMRDETQALLRARIDEAIRRLDLVKREELEAVQELAANARAGQETAESELAAMRGRLADLEARVSALEVPKAAVDNLQG